MKTSAMLLSIVLCLSTSAFAAPQTLNCVLKTIGRNSKGEPKQIDVFASIDVNAPGRIETWTTLSEPGKEPIMTAVPTIKLQIKKNYTPAVNDADGNRVSFSGFLVSFYDLDVPQGAKTEKARRVQNADIYSLYVDAMTGFGMSTLAQAVNNDGTISKVGEIRCVKESDTEDDLKPKATTAASPRVSVEQPAIRPATPQFEIQKQEIKFPLTK